MEVGPRPSGHVDAPWGRGPCELDAVHDGGELLGERLAVGVGLQFAARDRLAQGARADLDEIGVALHEERVGGVAGIARLGEQDADGTFATDGPLVHAPAPELIEGRGLTHFNLVGQYGVRETAQWVNQVQEPAASTRLGIPVTLSTDPRHAFTDHPGASFNSGACSAWPEPLGLAAIGDPALVERFGDTVRREYLAVGFRVALHPPIDLATEPRWSRRSGTFGSSAEPTSELIGMRTRILPGTRLRTGLRRRHGRALPRRRTSEGRRGPALRAGQGADLPGRPA